MRGLTNKTTSLFVHSDEGKTYLLLLSSLNKTGDSIVIDVEGQRQTAREQAALVPQPPKPVTTQSSDYVRSIKQLMLGMMSGRAGIQGLHHQLAYETVPLWKGVQFVKTGQYTAADMLAEVYTLSNIVKKMTQARKKQLAVLAIVAAVLGVVVASAVFVIERRKTETKEQTQVQQKERIVTAYGPAIMIEKGQNGMIRVQPQRRGETER